MGRTGTLAKDKKKKRGIEVDVRNRHPRIRKKKRGAGGRTPEMA